MGRDGKIKRETPLMLVMFETWYRVGKNFEKTRQTLAAEVPPVKVPQSTIYRYSRLYDWDGRAKVRDMEVAQSLHAEAVKTQTEFMQRTLQTGRLMQMKGVKFINDDAPKLKDPLDPSKGYIPGTGTGGIKSDFAAIQAVKLGLELERVGLQLPDQVVGVQGTGAGGAIIVKVIREAKVVKEILADDRIDDSGNDDE